MEGEQREEQEAHIQAQVRPPPEQVHQSRSKGQAIKHPRSSIRQERQEQPKQARPEARYDLRILQPAYFSHPFGHPGALSSIGFSGSQMQWCLPPMMPTHPIWVNYPSMMPVASWGWGAPRQSVFERLEFLTNDGVDSSSSRQNIEPVNEEKTVLKSEIERNTTNDVIQIGTRQVKLNVEFNRPIIINDQVDTIMEDVALDRREKKTDKVVDSKYLQPRWCPPGPKAEASTTTACGDARKGARDATG
jgi:hypothetical protein